MVRALTPRSTKRDVEAVQECNPFPEQDVVLEHRISCAEPHWKRNNNASRPGDTGDDSQIAASLDRAESALGSATQSLNQDGCPVACRRHTSQNHSRWYPTAQSDTAAPLIYDEYATFKTSYDKPKCPVVLAHGLFGFDELRLAGPISPPVRYWRGIEEELLNRGIHVITVAVQPLGTIEERARALMKGIGNELYSKREGELGVNIIAAPKADMPRESTQKALLHALEKSGIDTGGVHELTRKYLNDVFNPITPDVEGVKYQSYGAIFVPRVWSAFRKPYKIILNEEGPNDGMVSVKSARWGQYKGTLVDVDHLDLINWANRARTFAQAIRGKKKFNAIAFYLDILDKLAKEGF
ncbi:hypothetical protein KEM54_001753 [Ascosphaera aggregata]|nr:hypothetical protein KEM54_001753 [Ascosphaera aggregata]